MALRGLLLGWEPIPDDLEDHVVVGKREHDHDQPRNPGSSAETLVGALDVSHEVAIQLGLAVLAEADRGVELRAPTVGHETVQELHEGLWMGHLDEEGGARIREENRDVFRLEQHGPDVEAAAVMANRQHERDRLTTDPHAPHDVCPRTPVEHRIDHINPLRGTVHPSIGKRPVDCGGGQGTVGPEMAPAGMEPAVADDVAHQIFGRGRHLVAANPAGNPRHRTNRLRFQELDRGIDTLGVKDAPSHRVEERLGNLQVRGSRQSACDTPLSSASTSPCRSLGSRAG